VAEARTERKDELAVPSPTLPPVVPVVPLTVFGATTPVTLTETFGFAFWTSVLIAVLQAVLSLSLAPANLVVMACAADAELPTGTVIV